MPVIEATQAIFRARTALRSGNTENSIEQALRSAWSENAAVRNEARKILAAYGVTVEDHPPAHVRAGERTYLTQAGEAG